jgi:hypothetical protein
MANSHTCTNATKIVAMKRIIILLLGFLFLTACKKEKAKVGACERVIAINGNKLEYDNDGRLAKYSDGFTGSDYIVSYENNGRKMEVLRSRDGVAFKYILDEIGLKILDESYTAAGVMYKKVTSIRDSKGYLTDETYEDFNSTSGVLDKRVVFHYTYTFDGNGNVIKLIQTVPANPSYMYTTEFVYDLTQKYARIVYNGQSLLFKELRGTGRDIPSPVNRLVKVRQNGVDAIGFIYDADAAGRVTFNRQTPLISGETAWEATITYECN